MVIISCLGTDNPLVTRELTTGDFFSEALLTMQMRGRVSARDQYRTEASS